MVTQVMGEPSETRDRAAANEGPLDFCQTILAHLPWPGGESSSLARTVGLTSCYRGEGVSTVASRLALAAASCGDHKVLLVDADVACPSVHTMFSTTLTPGLSNVLFDPTRLSASVQQPSESRLFILSAGNGGRNLFRDCDEAKLAVVFESLKSEFDLVVFDLPATTAPDFPHRLAGMLDGVLWVVEAERIWPEDALRTKELLAGANAQIIGTVLNRARRRVPRWLDGRS